MNAQICQACRGLNNRIALIYVDPANNMVTVKARYTPEPEGGEDENISLFRQTGDRLSK